MTRILSTRPIGLNGAVLALTLLAVLFSGLIPQGFMLGRAGDGGGPTITVCTGHGSVAIPSPFAPKQKPAKPGGQGVCAFAGHAAPAALPALAVLPVRYARVAFDHDLARLDQRPGLGLAAPPPPAQAPPSNLT